MQRLRSILRVSHAVYLPPSALPLGGRYTAKPVVLLSEKFAKSKSESNAKILGDLIKNDL
jgi:hypothetical protein